MPWNGSGIFSRLYSWQADKAAGIDISSVRMDADSNDIVASGLNNCITRDGQGQPTANLSMAGFRHTNASNGVAAQDYVTVGQITGGSILGVTPVGGGMDFYGTTAPAGWLFASGAAVSRTTYATLFAIIGTTFGAGDGTTTFNLPDKRGRLSLPLDNLGGTPASRVTVFSATSLGQSGGDQNLQGHVHGTTDPTHTHTATVFDPGHTHGVSDAGHGHTLPGQVVTSGTGVAVGASSLGLGLSATNTSTTGIGIVGAATGVGVSNTGAVTGITISSAGAGVAQNMPPVLVCTYIIYAGA